METGFPTVRRSLRASDDQIGREMPRKVTQISPSYLHPLVNHTKKSWVFVVSNSCIHVVLSNRMFGSNPTHQDGRCLVNIHEHLRRHRWRASRKLAQSGTALWRCPREREGYVQNPILIYTGFVFCLGWKNNYKNDSLLAINIRCILCCWVLKKIKQSCNFYKLKLLQQFNRII